MHYGTKPGHFETLKIHFPTSSGVSKVSERASQRGEKCGASKRVRGESERANRRASGQVLQSVFLVILAHSAMAENGDRMEIGEKGEEIKTKEKKIWHFRGKEDDSRNR